MSIFGTSCYYYLYKFYSFYKIRNSYTFGLGMIHIVLIYHLYIGILLRFVQRHSFYGRIECLAQPGFAVACEFDLCITRICSFACDLWYHAAFPKNFDFVFPFSTLKIKGQCFPYFVLILMCQ